MGRPGVSRHGSRPGSGANGCRRGSHVLVVKPDSTVWSWGRNLNGQLGSNSTTDRNAPGQVSGFAGVRNVTAGTHHSLALKHDGTVWGWGYNNYGQLGDGATTQRLVPVQASGLEGMLDVAAGEYHSLGLKSGGKVYAWGYNYYGQLGDGTVTNRNTATQVLGIVDAVAIAARSHHALALRADGTVWSWGNNNYGQLGDGSATNRNTATYVSGLSSVVAIAAGVDYSLALKRDGTVWAWGRNHKGQLGDGTTTNRSAPVQVSLLTDGFHLQAGGHSLLLKAEGTVWAWGENGGGQLGDGLLADRNAPSQTVNLALSAQVEMPTVDRAGGFYPSGISVAVACATSGAALHYTTNGQIPTASDPSLASGDSLEFGNGVVTLRIRAFKNGLLPSEIRSVTYGLGGMIGAGDNHSLAARSDGRLYTWGSNYYGQLGDNQYGDRLFSGGEFDTIRYSPWRPAWNSAWPSARTARFGPGAATSMANLGTVPPRPGSRMCRSRAYRESGAWPRALIIPWR